MLNHIGFIMDGNRRFSKKNAVSLEIGYKKGMEQFIEVLKFQIKNQIKNTSFFALSCDNYEKRKESELKPIVDLLKEFFKNKEIIGFLKINKFHISIKGDIEKIEEKKTFLKTEEKKFLASLKEELQKINSNTSNPKFFAHIALNYDGQQEILHSFKKLLEKNISKEELSIEKIKENLYFNDILPPEIIVRPGDAPRLSGFLLFDSQYSEIYLTKKLWPELTQEDFEEILIWYKNQKRNFGK